MLWVGGETFEDLYLSPTTIHWTRLFQAPSTLALNVGWDPIHRSMKQPLSGPHHPSREEFLPNILSKFTLYQF